MRKIANVGLSCTDTNTQTRVCTYLHAVFTPQGILECRPSLVVTHAQLGPLVMQVSLIHFGSCRTPYPCFHPRINSLVHRVVLKRDLSFCPLFSPFFLQGDIEIVSPGKAKSAKTRELAGSALPPGTGLCPHPTPICMSALFSFTLVSPLSLGLP